MTNKFKPIPFDNSTKYLLIAKPLLGTPKVDPDGDPETEAAHAWVYLGFNGKNQPESELGVTEEIVDYDGVKHPDGYYLYARIVSVSGKGVVKPIDEISAVVKVKESDTFSENELKALASDIDLSEYEEMLDIIASQHDAVIDW